MEDPIDQIKRLQGEAYDRLFADITHDLLMNGEAAFTINRVSAVAVPWDEAKSGADIIADIQAAVDRMNESMGVRPEQFGEPIYQPRYRMEWPEDPKPKYLMAATAPIMLPVSPSAAYLLNLVDPDTIVIPERNWRQLMRRVLTKRAYRRWRGREKGRRNALLTGRRDSHR